MRSSSFRNNNLTTRRWNRRSGVEDVEQRRDVPEERLQLLRYSAATIAHYALKFDFCGHAASADKHPITAVICRFFSNPRSIALSPALLGGNAGGEYPECCQGLGVFHLVLTARS